MNRKNLLSWLPWAIFAIIMLTDLRPIVLGTLQRGLLATGLWKAELPARPARVPVVTTGSGGTYPHPLPLVSPTGQPFNLSELRGKVVFVNIWASWCPPCVAEMPGIQALHDKLDPAKVAFIMVSLDENPAKAQRLFQRRRYTLPYYFPTAQLTGPFSSNSIPTTVILDRNGQVVARHEGMADYDTPEFRQALEKLAAN